MCKLTESRSKTVLSYLYSYKQLISYAYGFYCNFKRLVHKNIQHIMVYTIHIKYCQTTVVATELAGTTVTTCVDVAVLAIDK